MKRRTPVVVIATSWLSMACSEHDEQLAGGATDRMPQFRIPLRTLPWLADFRLGTEPDDRGKLTRLTNIFRPGESIYLSMRINEVPSGTVVSAYWYGPNDVTLAYASKRITPDKDRLRFVQNDTMDWQQGAYRAEVWIGDIKLNERHFEIASL